MLLSYKENILPVEWHNNVVHYATRSSKNHITSIRKTLHKTMCSNNIYSVICI